MDEKYVKCKYCSNLYNYKDNHVQNCNVNYDEMNRILSCFSCGEKDKEYSKSQLAKEDKARCTNCVTNNNRQKFSNFAYLYYNDYDNIELMTKEAQLKYYVGELNLHQVTELLQQNANTNYIRQAGFLDNYDGLWLRWYNIDGSEKPEQDNNNEQPTTPLKLCVFRFSDCTIEEEDRVIILKIAQLLIDYGANKEDPLQYFIKRYGEQPVENGIWYNFYNLLYQ